ncbi:MAG: thermonuclease family protein [Bacillota bacterium]
MRIIGGLIVLGIIISALSWALENILGILGLGLAAWGIYEWNKNKKMGAKSKVPGVIVATGLCLSLGWFGLSGDNATSQTQAVQNTPSTTNQVQQASVATSNQTTQTSQNQTVETPPVPLISTTVTKVVDGDTIHVTIDGKDETIRLIGVDTPETHHPSKPVQPYGPEAEQFTRSQLDGKQVWLEKDVQERDKYGRLLAYVWTSQPAEINDKEIRDKMFNAKLALEGYAQQLTIPPDVKYSEYFTTYVREARDASKGLWGLAGTPSGQAQSNAPPTQKVSQPAPAVQPTPAVNKQEVTVYVTDTGSKYHTAGCQYLRKSQHPISLSNAKAQGYTPCSKCGPPR